MSGSHCTPHMGAIIRLKHKKLKRPRRPKQLRFSNVLVLFVTGQDVFLRDGRVRVSFREKTVRDRRLADGLCFGDEDIPVTRDAEKLTVVYVRDLPYEVTICLISSVLLARS